MLLSLIQRTANSRVASLAFAALHTPAVPPSRVSDALINRSHVHPFPVAGAAAAVVVAPSSSSSSSSSEVRASSATSTVVPSAAGAFEGDEFSVGDPRLGIWRDEEELLRASVERLEAERELASMRRKCEEELQSLREGLRVREGQVERIVRRVITRDSLRRRRRPFTEATTTTTAAAAAAARSNSGRVVSAVADEPQEMEASDGDCGARSSSDVCDEVVDGGNHHVDLSSAFVRDVVGQVGGSAGLIPPSLLSLSSSSSSSSLLPSHAMERHTTYDDADDDNAAWGYAAETAGSGTREQGLKGETRTPGRRRRSSSSNNSNGRKKNHTNSSSSSRSSSSSSRTTATTATGGHRVKEVLVVKRAVKQPVSTNKRKSTSRDGGGGGGGGSDNDGSNNSSGSHTTTQRRKQGSIPLRNASPARRKGKSINKQPPKREKGTRSETMKTTGKSGTGAPSASTRRRQVWGGTGPPKGSLH